MRYRKKRAKEAQQNPGIKKKKRGHVGVKVKCLGGEVKRVKSLLNVSPKAELAPGKENVNSQVNPATVPARPGKVNSVQNNPFLDRRLNTEAFLVSLCALSKLFIG